MNVNMDDLIDDRGLFMIENAQCALDALRNLCGEMKHLDQVPGDGMAWLLHFVAVGVGEALDDQRQELSRVSKLLKSKSSELATIKARLTTPLRRRRDEEIRREIARASRDGGGQGIFGQIVAEARADAEAQEAFDNEVKTLLGEADGTPPKAIDEASA